MSKADNYRMEMSYVVRDTLSKTAYCCCGFSLGLLFSASLAIKAEQSAHVIEMSSTRVCPQM